MLKKEVYDKSLKEKIKKKELFQIHSIFGEIVMLKYFMA